MRDALLELEHLAHTKLSNLVPLDMKNMSLSHIIRGKYSSLYFTASYFQPGFPAWLQLIANRLNIAICPTNTRAQKEALGTIV